MGFMTGLARWPIVVSVAMALMVSSAPARAGDSAPPADLVRIERLVGLRVAHVRDQDLAGSEDRKSFLKAQQDDALGEQALRARDYDKAMSYFQHANGALDALERVGK